MKHALLSLLFSLPAWAQDLLDVGGTPEPTPTEVERDPAAVVIKPRTRSFVGGESEEDLKVLPALPGAEIKVDARTLQRDVYKSVYNQDLKEERHDDAAEE